MTDYNNGLWYGHNGEPCPVHPKSTVEIRMHKANDSTTILAGNARWSHTGAANDVVAFRVVKAHQEPREFWVDPSVGSPEPGDGLIKVQEVSQ